MKTGDDRGRWTSGEKGQFDDRGKPTYRRYHWVVASEMWTIMKPQELPKWKGLEDIGRMDKIGPERHIEMCTLSRVTRISCESFRTLLVVGY